MTELIAFPFAIAPDGMVATIDDGTDEWVQQQLHVTIGTKPDEREMARLFGVPDPAFNGLEIGDIQASLDLYGPFGITITDVTTTPISNTDVDVQVQWDRDDNDNESDGDL